MLAVVMFAGLRWISNIPDARDTALSLPVANPQVVHMVEDVFPGAMAGHKLFSKVVRALNSLGIKPANTIYGQSICSDEINNEPSHISSILTKYYGKVFPMGGIGGAPYVGKTGFGAFAAHVPEDGHVVVLFGPHIGFTPEGEAGKFLRFGQAHASTACGAAVAAYNQCISGGMPDDPDDLQQSWLRRRLMPHCKNLAQSNNLMVDLALQAYKEVEKEIMTIVNTNFGPGKLVLLGGIQINMPYPTPGFFYPLHFSIRSAFEDAQNLLPELS